MSMSLHVTITFASVHFVNILNNSYIYILSGIKNQRYCIHNNFHDNKNEFWHYIKPY